MEPNVVPGRGPETGRFWQGEKVKQNSKCLKWVRKEVRCEKPQYVTIVAVI